MSRAFVVVNLLAAFAAGLCGCSTTASETHYFRTETESGGIPNYFRLQINASTWFSSARYLSGYFDEEVINQYFNEIGQPEAGRLVPVSNTGSAPSTAANATSASSPNPRLVILLSTNSDEIANQLGALSQSNEFTASLASVISRSRFGAASTAERQLGIDRAQGHSLALLGDQLTKNLAQQNIAGTEVEAQLLNYVNRLTGDLGAPGPFKTLTLAGQWLNDNRARLGKGGGS